MVAEEAKRSHERSVLFYVLVCKDSQRCKVSSDTIHHMYLLSDSVVFSIRSSDWMKKKMQKEKEKQKIKGGEEGEKKQRPEVKKSACEKKNIGAFLYVTPRSQQVRSFLHFSASFTRVKRREKMRMEEIKWLHRDRLCYRNVSISLSIFIDRLYICMTSQRAPRVINARVAWIIRPGSLFLSLDILYLWSMTRNKIPVCTYAFAGRGK